MALPFVLALLSGCDPHDATVSGDYAMYFAEATSDSITSIRAGYDAVDCEYTQKDPLADEIDAAQIFEDDCWQQKVDAEAELQKDWDLTPVDCRTTFGDPPYNDNEIRIRDTMIPGWEKEYEAQCCIESTDDDPDNDPDGDVFTPDDCTVGTGKFMNWLDDKAYYMNHGAVTTYREEAVITAEGDLQLTVHMNTPFGDVRFGWVVQPDYSPTECVTVDGKTSEEPLFGDADVVKNWSASEDGKTLFYINSGAFQVNPSDPNIGWYFDRTWDAASGFSRFAEDNAYVYATDYEELVTTNNGGLQYDPYFVTTDDDGNVTDGYGTFGAESYEELNCGGADQDACGLKDYPDFVEMMKDNFNNGGTAEDGSPVRPAQDDLANYGRLPQADFPFEVKIEDNSWRETAPGEGGNAQGFDNWVGVNPSWVTFDTDVDSLKALEPGAQDTPLKGEFQLYFQSADTSGSVWFFHGTFEIATIERDTWGYSPEFDEIKREENATVECGD